MNPYKIFIDTEFNQTVDPVELISLGIVTADGREFYATSSEFDPAKCDSWLNDHVMPVLHSPEVLKDHTAYFPSVTREKMRTELETFLGNEKFDAWGYYADYDWFLFTRLWGSFMNMPKSFPEICFDVKQYAYFRLCPNVHRHVREFEPQHHALVDARWTRTAHEFVRDFQAYNK